MSIEKTAIIGMGAPVNSFYYQRIKEIESNY